MKLVTLIAALAFALGSFAQSTPATIGQAAPSIELPSNAAFMAFYANHATRVFPYAKTGDTTALPAAQLLHKTEQRGFTSSDLASFDPTDWDLGMQDKLPVFYAIDANTTIMVLSAERILQLWEREQINQNAQQNRK